jgi:hypothetical protein
MVLQVNGQNFFCEDVYMVLQVNGQNFFCEDVYMVLQVDGHGFCGDVYMIQICNSAKILLF